MSDKPALSIEEETAYHEAGHAVIACLIGRFPLFVSIVPDGAGVVGKTEFDNDVPLGSKSYLNNSDVKKKYIRTRVMIEVAGTIAHDVKLPGRRHDQGDECDDYWAKRLVSESVSWDNDHEGYLKRARGEVEVLLRANFRLMEEVAGALSRQRKLDRTELRAICESRV